MEIQMPNFESRFRSKWRELFTEIYLVCDQLQLQFIYLFHYLTYECISIKLYGTNRTQTQTLTQHNHYRKGTTTEVQHKLNKYIYIYVYVNIYICI